jgi:N-acetylgalactosamine PTS system EIIA component
MSETPVLGVVVAHAELADGLVSAVRRIAGLEDSAIQALSNEGLGPDALRDRLNDLLGERPAIVFVDLREGSCGICGRRVCLGRADRVLVTGVNLPMLLDFAMNRDRPLGELARRLVDRGRGAIGALPEPESP